MNGKIKEISNPGEQIIGQIIWNLSRIIFIYKYKDNNNIFIYIVQYKIRIILSFYIEFYSNLKRYIFYVHWLAVKSRDRITSAGWRVTFHWLNARVQNVHLSSSLIRL